MNIDGIREALWFLSDSQFQMVMDTLSGERVYFPRFSRFEKKQRDLHILEDYRGGMSIHSIARIYKITPRHARRVLDTVRKDSVGPENG